MSNTSLLKTVLHSTIAESIYNEVTSRQSRYYYFLGRTLTWDEEATPPLPSNCDSYIDDVRRDIITVKEIKPNDISFVINRYDWQPNLVYDQYDDKYCTEVIGLNLISGGYGFISLPNVYIGTTGSTAWVANSSFSRGDLLSHNDNYYVVENSGVTSSTIPTHTSGTVLNGDIDLTYVVLSDGNGSGAMASAVLLDGAVIELQLIDGGSGYTAIPSVLITGGNGLNAFGSALIGKAASGSQVLETSLFYVLTDEFNLYKCIDNNNNSISTYKPIGTTVDPITFPDGYIWKFIYNVPIALRNKFLTNSYIPIITALKNQFYSNGNIQTVRIDQKGRDYTSGSIIVTGDGYLESDPYYLTSLTVSNAGVDYTSIEVNIDFPYTNISEWSASTLVILGQKIYHEKNIYEVVISGTTSVDAPIHLIGTISNGTAALKYIGTQASAVADLTDGEISSITLFGMMREVVISNHGSGYTGVPTITISGDGSGATASAILQSGSVKQIIVTSPGIEYTEAPTVVVGTAWTATTSLTVGTQVFASNRLYTVSVAGTTGSSAPSHTSGSVANGGATLTYAGVAATATTLLKYGSGYNHIPSVSFSGDGTDATGYISGVKSNAKLIPTFSDGELSLVQIEDGGVGYTYANIVVNGDGTDASVSVDLSPGTLNTLQSNIELLTVSGGILNISVISGGYGYSNATVTITGDGSGAAATVTILSGVIKKINMTSYGSGYTYAVVTISGTGFGATARAIISPYGGHGKNALKELFARSLMFYSSLSNDSNQGFSVNNDYRQVGVIKSLKSYGSTYSFSGLAGSACWVLSATNSPSTFPVDSIINMVVSGSPRFRIVSNTGEALLVQSLDNRSPSIGSSFTNSNSDILTANAVTPPTVDKYSGDLLFIDNKQAFTPTTEEAVTLRTVIKF